MRSLPSFMHTERKFACRQVKWYNNVVDNCVEYSLDILRSHTRCGTFIALPWHFVVFCSMFVLWRWEKKITNGTENPPQVKLHWGISRAQTHTHTPKNLLPLQWANTHTLAEYVEYFCRFANAVTVHRVPSRCSDTLDFVGVQVDKLCSVVACRRWRGLNGM